MSLKSLQQAVDAVLIDTIPPRLKTAVDAALAGGGTHKEILRRARQQAGKRSTTVLQVEAYLESLKTKSN